MIDSKVGIATFCVTDEMKLLIVETYNSLEDIEVGKFYRINGMSFSGRIGDDFLWDYDFCGKCIRNNGTIAMIRFGNLDERTYNDGGYYRIMTEFGVSKYMLDSVQEISSSEYRKVIDTYNDRATETRNAKYPMPTATI